MQNRFILTPFFLDDPCSELESVAQPNWLINKPSLPSGNQYQRIAALHRRIVDFVAETLRQGNRPVSIAGDCCAAIGALAGVQQAGLNPVVLWLDAHGDFNTWETTPSGFLGGMPLAMIVGRGDQSMLDAVGMQPVSEVRVILTDGRDLDPGERQALASSNIFHTIDSLSLLEHPLLHEPLFIHLDPDILDPVEAPAMSYPAIGGPSFKELHALFSALAQMGKIVAVSMSTWNPRLDEDGQNQKICMELLDSLIHYR